MSAGRASDDAQPCDDAAQVASLDAVRDRLVADAQSWATQLQELSALAARAERAGTQVRRTLALELAGSWQIGQLTAERWVSEAERFHDALPMTLAMLGSGTLLRHQAVMLLHRTQQASPEVARAVEAEVLPDASDLCPSDLARRVDRVRLRLESELMDAEQLEQQEAEKVAGRRTFVRPTDVAMMLAGAILTPEQGAAWAAGMDALERRERLADRAAGVERTADQRRADLFAALPALVLAGTAQDDAFRRAAGMPSGGRTSTPPDECGLLFEQDMPAPPPWTFAPDQVAAHVVLNLHVPVSTVLELSQEPGTLERYGPVSAEHVRLLRPHSFRCVMVDHRSGRPVAVDDDSPTPVDPDQVRAREQVQDMLRPAVVVDPDELQHDPSARLARLVDLRDVRCAGPGCASTRCDRDHLERYPDGPTSARNLGLVSRRCHSAKHAGWTLQRHLDGSVTWSSPLGRSYDRPGPWAPPPEVDLHEEPRPLRPRPTAPPPWDSRDTPLVDDLPEAAAEPVSNRAVVDDLDEPPPF